MRITGIIFALAGKHSRNKTLTINAHTTLHSLHAPGISSFGLECDIEHEFGLSHEEMIFISEKLKAARAREFFSPRFTKLSVIIEHIKNVLWSRPVNIRQHWNRPLDADESDVFAVRR